MFSPQLQRHQKKLCEFCSKRHYFEFLNLQPAWWYICGYLCEKVNPYLFTVTRVWQNIVWTWYIDGWQCIYGWQVFVFVGFWTFKVQNSPFEAPCTTYLRIVNRFCWQKNNSFSPFVLYPGTPFARHFFQQNLLKTLRHIVHGSSMEDFWTWILKISHTATLLPLFCSTQERLLHAISFNRICLRHSSKLCMEPNLK